MTVPPWLGMGLVLVLVLVALAGLSALRRRGADPEVARKALHIFLGLVVLSFPWLFEAIWPVVLLSVLSTVLLLAVRTIPSLRAGLGGVLHDVSRRSLGEFGFVLGILTLFLAAGRDPLRYVLPVLLLTLADPAAALAGRATGSPRYGTGSDAKSVAGSVAFCAVGAASACLCLTASGTGAVEVLSIALPLALLTTLVEAVSPYGLDNLTVPLSCLVLLDALQIQAMSARIGTLGISLLLTAVLLYLLSRRRHLLSGAEAP